METPEKARRVQCDGCGMREAPLQKLSLGKNFFGLPYDRLSPASDLSPQWYCETCSTHKNLQRDFRDIQAELAKWAGGSSSEITKPDQLQRVRARLREITLFLDQAGGRSLFLKGTDVAALIRDVDARLGAITERKSQTV